VQFGGAVEDVVELALVVVQITLHQGAGEVVLVLEMVEEAALGYADAGDQFLDRGRGESLLQDQLFGEFKQALPVGSGLCDMDELYHRYSVGRGRA
jgi:hypothetical protein